MVEEIVDEEDNIINNVEFYVVKKSNGKNSIEMIVDRTYKFFVNQVAGTRRYFRCSKYRNHRCRATAAAVQVFDLDTNPSDVNAPFLLRCTALNNKHNHNPDLVTELVEHGKEKLHEYLLTQPASRKLHAIYSEFIAAHSESLADWERELFLDQFPALVSIKCAMARWRRNAGIVDKDKLKLNQDTEDKAVLYKATDADVEFFEVERVPGKVTIEMNVMGMFRFNQNHGRDGKKKYFRCSKHKLFNCKATATALKVYETEEDEGDTDRY